MKGWIDSNSPISGERVELLFDRLVSAGLPPSQKAYKFVLNAHINSPEAKEIGLGICKAEKILKQMDERRLGQPRKSVRPNTKMANMILQGMSMHN